MCHSSSSPAPLLVTPHLPLPLYSLQVWPGMVYYPDWFHPATQPWWTRAVKRMYSQVPLDGLWVDMNEAASFCTGTICRAPDPKTNNESYYCEWVVAGGRGKGGGQAAIGLSLGGQQGLYSCTQQAQEPSSWAQQGERQQESMMQWHAAMHVRACLMYSWGMVWPQADALTQFIQLLLV
jgi:alpha-glucosidase (family GH31 glycosyl hydrolase)